MAFLQDIQKKIETYFAVIAGFFKGLAEKFRLPDFGDLGRSLHGRWRIVLVCAAGGLVLLIFAGVAVKNTGKEAHPARPESIPRRLAIPSEELFLPDEPDFLPGVLLERERRTKWTEQDAALHWQNPLKNGEEEWREKVEAAIDEFLESVP